MYALWLNVLSRKVQISRRFGVLIWFLEGEGAGRANICAASNALVSEHGRSVNSNNFRAFVAAPERCKAALISATVTRS